MPVAERILELREVLDELRAAIDELRDRLDEIAQPLSREPSPVDVLRIVGVFDARQAARQRSGLRAEQFGEHMGKEPRRLSAVGIDASTIERQLARKRLLRSIERAGAFGRDETVVLALLLLESFDEPREAVPLPRTQRAALRPQPLDVDLGVTTGASDARRVLQTA